MKRLLTLALILIATACSEPAPTTQEAIPSSDKKSGSTTTAYTVVNVPATNWNITSDTSACGTLILRWTNQNRPTGASNYYFIITPQQPTCAGGLNTSTNILYYTYGWGCSFWPMTTYSVTIAYNWRDDINKKIFVYTSTPTTVVTGRGSWNCN